MDKSRRKSCRLLGESRSVWRLRTPSCAVCDSFNAGSVYRVRHGGRAFTRTMGMLRHGTSRPPWRSDQWWWGMDFGRNVLGRALHGRTTPIPFLAGCMANVFPDPDSGASGTCSGFGRLCPTKGTCGPGTPTSSCRCPSRTAGLPFRMSTKRLR